jgi:hypothetical protein
MLWLGGLRSSLTVKIEVVEQIAEKPQQPITLIDSSFGPFEYLSERDLRDASLENAFFLTT